MGRGMGRESGRPAEGRGGGLRRERGEEPGGALCGWGGMCKGPTVVGGKPVGWRGVSMGSRN